ncbi:hypothetical protein RCG23_14670 [Neobacillus sp. PS3-34]|uniref:hypothetical protein n=1 Tax=Neobacillus sp. PS3-34 TaxID=3070678 RepID=UPI0027E1B3E2|nr:hypothetical protein [Neobacillus sp. PS3-34]WML46877.1 hypothetical protein RCG23_14670 [Neobacillus sp. PS3-34]
MKLFRAFSKESRGINRLFRRKLIQGDQLPLGLGTIIHMIEARHLFGASYPRDQANLFNNPFGQEPEGQQIVFKQGEPPVLFDLLAQ